MAEPLPPPPPAVSADYRSPGDVVRITGLQGRSDLNGQCAEVLHWDSASQRFAVAVSASGETVKVRSQNLAARESLLVTVVSGLPGTGKSALVRHVLSAGRQEGLRVALLVNDSRGIADRPRQDVLTGREECLRLDGGCICCSLREEFVSAVVQLARRGSADYLLVESADHAGPRQIAELFRAVGEPSQPSEEGASGRRARRRRSALEGLNDCASLDTMVSVLDGTAILGHLQEGDDSAADDSRGAPREPALAQLMVRQAEFADMLVIGSSAPLTDAQRGDVKSFLGMLNPEAGCLFSAPTEVPTYEVLGRGAYMWRQLEVRQPTRKWLEEGPLDPAAAAASPALASRACGAACCALPQGAQASQQSDVTSFSFRPARPFHPGRVMALVNGVLCLPPSVLRITGTCWLASRSARRGVWSMERGCPTEITAGPPWWIGVPRTKWPDAVPSQLIQKGLLSQEGRWTDERFGDCHSELAVVGGRGFRPEVLEVYLTELLVNDEEFGLGPAAWALFEDPLPAWSVGVDSDTLYCLALSGAEEMLGGLLLQGADANARNTINDGTALHAACLKGRTRVVELLLSSKADAGLVAQRDLAPIHLAACGEVVDLLHKYRSDMQLPDVNGYTPLHHAAGMAKVSVVSALLACRAPPNALTSGLETPLQLAAASGHTMASEVARALCLARADPGMVSGVSGQDAYTVARQSGSGDLVEALLAFARRQG